MRSFVKKYRFKIKRFFENRSEKFCRELKFFTEKRSPFSYDIFEIDQLSFPAHWELLPNNSNILEIGSGHGELLEFLANKYPESNVIGFEITRDFTRKSAKKIANTKNAKVFCGEGYRNVLNLFPDRSIDSIYILFPDPWHKKKHHKRRPLTKDWLVKVSKKIKRGGFIYFASDWLDYYDFVMKQFNELNLQKTIYKVETGHYIPTEQGLIETHYYKKWLEIGRSFKYIRAEVV